MNFQYGSSSGGWGGWRDHRGGRQGAQQQQQGNTYYPVTPLGPYSGPLGTAPAPQQQRPQSMGVGLASGLLQRGTGDWLSQFMNRFRGY